LPRLEPRHPAEAPAPASFKRFTSHRTEYTTIVQPGTDPLKTVVACALDTPFWWIILFGLLHVYMIYNIFMEQLHMALNYSALLFFYSMPLAIQLCINLNNSEFLKIRNYGIYPIVILVFIAGRKKH
jgi:hypothetical protein